MPVYAFQSRAIASKVKSLLSSFEEDTMQKKPHNKKAGHFGGVQDPRIERSNVCDLISGSMASINNHKRT